MFQIDAELQSNDYDRLYAGLNMIYQIGRVYEFIMKERRKDLKILVSRYFPTLDTVLQVLLCVKLDKEQYIPQEMHSDENSAYLTPAGNFF